MSRKPNRQFSEQKFAALINDNIRLRSAANRIWLRWYFVPLLFGGTFLFAYLGAYFGAS